MSTVTEILAAIDQLSPQERCELEVRLHPWQEDNWDLQMQTDSEAGGKLHDLMKKSLVNYKEGKVNDWPTKPANGSRKLIRLFGNGIMHYQRTFD